MGCNCKGSKQIINNLKSPDHLRTARSILTDVLTNKTEDQIDEMDYVELKVAYSTLYPNSPGYPPMDRIVEEINKAISLYNVKY